MRLDIFLTEQGLSKSRTRASDLISALGAEMQPNTLTKRLNVRAGKLLNDYGIGYDNTHGRNGSRITLKLTEQAM